LSDREVDTPEHYHEWADRVAVFARLWHNEIVETMNAHTVPLSLRHEASKVEEAMQDFYQKVCGEWMHAERCERDE
jgi:hypothetical protein